MTTLKALRRRAGLSREEFARLTETSPDTLEKHEQGKHRLTLEAATTYAQTLAGPLGAAPGQLLQALAGLDE